MADLGSAPALAYDLSVTLLGKAGQVLLGPEDAEVRALCGREATGLYACTDLAAIVLRWSSRAVERGPRFIRLYFAGVAQTDTWNSWLRAPRLPPSGAIELCGDVGLIAERRFPVALSASVAPLPIREGTLIELELAQPSEADTGELSLKFPIGPYLLRRVELSAEPHAGASPDSRAAPDLPCYPLPQLQLAGTGDPLAEQLYALAGSIREPTLQDVWQLALPYQGGALLGIVEGPIVSQLWDGGLVWPERSGAYSRLWLRIGGLADSEPPSVAQQRLRGGYLPIAESQLRTSTELRHTAFVDLTGALRLRTQVAGDATGSPPALRFYAARAGLIKASNDPRAQAASYDPLPVELEPAEETLRFGTTVAQVRQQTLPDGSVTAELRIPLQASPSSGEAPGFDEALAAVEREATDFLRAGAQLDLPDAHLQNAWRALLLHNRLFQRGGILRYGLFPGVYEGGLFGIEEGWNIVAMAQYGHGRLAHDLLARTFFDAEFLKKEGQHHQYRSGLCITYARDVHALTGDDAALRELWPQIVSNADWIAAAFRSTQELLPSGERPVHYGMLPKHTYGGDLTEPAYSLYGSSAAWRGLRDAALLARVVDDPRGEQWAQAAARTRVHLHTAADRIYRRDASPPFLPFRTDDSGPSPSAGDYHQLFASLILETALYGWHGWLAQSITDYLQASGRQTLGVARFDKWFGRLGVDAEYSRGTQLCALHRRQFDRFYLGLLGQFGLSCDPQTFVSPETAIVRFTRSDYQDRLRAIAEQPARFDSDPCSAGTAVMLQYLRYLLAVEERDDSDLPTGTLWLGAGAPRSWFVPGRAFAAADLPTSLGTVSLRCETSATGVSYHLSTARELPVEVFYFDRQGRQRSQAAIVSGNQTLVLPRE